MNLCILVIICCVGRVKFCDSVICYVSLLFSYSVLAYISGLLTSLLASLHQPHLYLLPRCQDILKFLHFHISIQLLQSVLIHYITIVLFINHIFGFGWIYVQANL